MRPSTSRSSAASSAVSTMVPTARITQSPPFRMISHVYGSTKGTCASPLGDVVSDSERKQAEERLRRSEQDYRRLFENAHDAILIFDPDAPPLKGHALEQLMRDFLAAMLTNQRLSRRFDELFLELHFFHIGLRG